MGGEGNGRLPLPGFFLSADFRECDRADLIDDCPKRRAGADRLVTRGI